MIGHNKRLPVTIAGIMLTGLSMISTAVTAAPSQTQIDALNEIYANLNGPQWANKGDWDTLTDPCAGWKGVTCDTGSNVTKLFIDDDNASGSIPASISALTELQELVISGIGLAGSTIPASIGSMSKLKGLFLNDNGLQGTIPPELGQLSQLQTLSLDDNRLSGNIPIELMSLTKLYGLRLHHNYLTGPIPTEISNLTNLLALTLHRNSLSGVIPSTLADLSNIDEISLDWNALHTADGTLSTFINQKSVSDNYIDTQTLDASANLEPEVGETAIKLFWDTRNTTPATEGGYKIYIATDAAGPYSLNQTVNDKNSDTTRVEGLIAGTTYFFQVRSYTSPHEENLQPSDLESSGLFYTPKEVTTLNADSGNDNVGGETPSTDGDSGSSSGGGGSTFWLLIALLPLGLRAKR